MVAAPTIFISTNDMDSIKNGLDSLLALQNASGALPYAGTPFGGGYSFTYHLHSLLDIDLYYQYTNDVAYLQDVWKNFTLGLAFSISHVDDTGLMNVTTSSDWLRSGMGGHVSPFFLCFFFLLLQVLKDCRYCTDTNSTARRTSRPTPSSTTPLTAA